GAGRLVSGAMADMPSMASFWTTGIGWSGPVLAVLAIWCAFEAVRLMRPQPDATLWSRLVSPVYRPAASAALMGLAAGSLYFVHRAWTYSSFLRSEVGSWLD